MLFRSADEEVDSGGAGQEGEREAGERLQEPGTGDAVPAAHDEGTGDRILSNPGEIWWKDALSMGVRVLLASNRSELEEISEISQVLGEGEVIGGGRRV